KTRTLTQRLIQMIKSGIEPNKILAITFTNKAADEMKSRIVRDVGAVRSLSSSNPSNPDNSDISNISNGALAPSEMPYVGTFHSFCARILRKEARHLGRTSSYTIFDSDDSKKLSERF
ncbi:MAG: UvrD-helicase domain-containing protein, partial [Bacteroidetes bacterium]|nr:UvrD-helicase domain-containing protein [Bacteroidota bacterium]